VGEVNGQLSAVFKYDSDFLSQEKVEQIAGLFTVAAEQLSQHADTPVFALSDTNGDPANLQGWPDVDKRGGETIASMLSSSIKEKPDAIAAYFGDDCLSYEQFDTLVGHLAQQLRERGCGLEVPVAVCFERSLELLIAVIAVIRSGAAYVPLDPDYPPQRLLFMIRDSGAKLILASASAIGRVAGTAVDSLVYDRGEAYGRDRNVEADPSGNFSLQTCGSCLAYIIYTSGTTGNPKGVAIEHKSLHDYAVWATHSLVGERGPALPMSASISFDAVLKQMLPPLLTGRAVRIIPSDVLSRPDQLLRALSEAGETALNCMPSLWRAVLQTADATGISLPPLRRLLLSGERLDRDLVQETLARYENLDLWNIYGPTEVTANACASAGLRGNSEPAIGRAISGVRAYVLGENLQPVARGMIGELFLGGSAVARGYVGRPDLTAERFMPDPFTMKPGQRMYGTGDFVRITPSGEVMFVKRRDRQVKVRGYRLELDEIEFVASAHPSVLEVVVTTRGDDGTVSLIAYVVPKPGSELSNAALRTFMREMLPSYAIPSAFLIMDKIPRLNSGKVDMHSLARDAVSLKVDENEAARIENPVEASIARLWGELLGVEGISADQGFFELGGNSLQATQFVSALQEHFGGDTPIMTLFFENPTVSGLAHALIEIAGGENADIDSILHALEVAARPPLDDVESLATIDAN
jgi:amino acid adenylation domain-containing protein